MSSSESRMYCKSPNIVFGFHGCSVDTFSKVIYEHQNLVASTNDYDWLGHGIYFWENNYDRALLWAKNKFLDKAKVIGAAIDLGYCLNVTDYTSNEVLKSGYDNLKIYYEISGTKLPINGKENDTGGILLRPLDCAVIQLIHKMRKNANYEPYDSVRGVFTEGDKVYPGSAFREKTHIQLCIINPNCIKGYFVPQKIDENFKCV